MPLSQLDTEHLEKFIHENGVRGQLIHINVPTPTVESAAAAVGTSPDKVIKSLIFLVDGNPVLVIASGIQKVDRRTIAKHFEVGRKKVKLADADTVQTVTGFVVGAVPPIGHLTPLTVVIDEQVLGHDLVYGGGGGIDKLLEIDPKEILNYTNATAIDLHT